ncbi:hypothetical protein CLHUN_43050 [Ruminiclostridium hungatei]|uniref:DUF5104 domain-containing protein n=1 Tax=Ruminiclostridium hungatei TaxID=48256 RepID=A0A1V4SE96_RUMHU|nr:DUF5104 domain-containing protein [Ruminiclostridium hungatei]OPX41826.1 hypothetical protein CLHUN_43050 [Ruminiclostridium hungatei]
MSKKIIVLLLLGNILLLSSCLGSRVGMLNKSNDDEKADARLKQIIESIKNKDKERIKVMFSEQALNEAKDLDERIDYLIALIKGNVESWDRIGGSVDETNNYGHKQIKSSFRYNVYTEQEQYLFSILEYTKDDDNPENVGVYSLKVINVKDEEPKFSDAGIYKPEK